MAPLSMFRSRVFCAANLMTLLVYGALGCRAVLPRAAAPGQRRVRRRSRPVWPRCRIPIVMLLLSSRSSVIAARTGPRLPMTVGPIVCALGALLLSGVDADASYWTDVFPGITLFALGLAALVSPLTVAVLAAAPGQPRRRRERRSTTRSPAPGACWPWPRCRRSWASAGDGLPRPRRAHRGLPPALCSCRQACWPSAASSRGSVCMRSAGSVRLAVHAIEESTPA